MRNHIRQLGVSLIVGLVVFSGLALADTLTKDSNSKLGSKVRSELVTMPYYTIFDNLAFRVDGSKVTLLGHVHWSSLKDTTERIVAGVEGVTSVNNQIEILPNSFFDNRIRLAVAQAIFSHPVLGSYTLKALPSIHIIVKNGNVTLEGLVAREMHKNIANLQAHGVSGVFSVTNNLRVENAKKEI